MSEKDGWTPGTYEIAMGRAGPDGGWEQTGTEMATGETWKTFGVEGDRSSRIWTVTHLPTGMAMADFERKGDAKRFCRQIANLIDWTTVTGTGIVRQPDDARAAVRDAMDRCHAVHLVRFR